VSGLSYSSLIPPNLFLLLTTLGVAIAWRRKWLGLTIATVGVGCLYLVSMPVFATLLIRSAVAMGDLAPGLPYNEPPGAIVVLSADVMRSGVAGRSDIVGPLTLERLAEAARQQRRLGLPILVSGGPADQPDQSAAALMSKTLQKDFGARVQWREDRSRNTFENAAFSAAILRQAGVHAAIVVAHPWDMARALWSFRAAGYSVVPAPTPGESQLSLSLQAFLPQIPALRDSYYALHEFIGLVWYRIRYAGG
jgi:uncharacterized SAM-binding protein YcdF (DUF218 family)